jgi:hypothetical protein
MSGFFADDDPRHGTYAGSMAHAYYKTMSCEPCLEASRLYVREHRRRHASGRSLTFPVEVRFDDFDGLGAAFARGLRESA